MDINVKTVDQATIVELVGDIDGKTAAQVQEQILPLVQPKSNLLLDMSQVGYMSSAGLRLLLSTYRHVTSNKANIVLAGVNEDIKDTMSATGFLRFFTLHDTVDAGLATFS
jgi:anti-sigma B factor antagonist